MAEQDITYQDKWLMWAQLYWRRALIVAASMAITFFSYFYWQERQKAKHERISAVYADIIDLADEYLLSSEGVEPHKLLGRINDIREEFPKSLHSLYATLIKIRIHAEKGDYQEALYEIDKLLESNDISKEITAFVTLQKGRVLFAQNLLQDVLGLLADADSDFMGPAFMELRGDVYVEVAKAYEQQGDTNTRDRSWREALYLYEEALKLNDSAPVSTLNMKIIAVRSFLESI